MDSRNQVIEPEEPPLGILAAMRNFVMLLSGLAMLSAVSLVLGVILGPVFLAAVMVLDHQKLGLEGRRRRAIFCVLCLWCFSTVSFPWVVTWGGDLLDLLGLPLRGALLAFFLSQLPLTAALLACIGRGEFFATPEIEGLRWHIFSRFSLRLAGLVLDWHSYSSLVLNLPGVRFVPSSIHEGFNRLLLAPWLVFRDLRDSRSMNVAGLLAIMTALLLGVMSSMFSRHICQAAPRIPGTSFLVPLVSNLPRPEDALGVMEDLCSMLFLPCLACCINIFLCTDKDCANGLPTHAGMYLASALLASYLPFVYAGGVWIRLTGRLHKQRASICNATGARLIKAAGHLLLERPLKVVAVGVMLLWPEDLGMEEVRLGVLLATSIGLALISKYIGASNHRGFNRMHEYVCWSMCLNTATGLAVTSLNGAGLLTESWWPAAVWIILQVLLWQCFFGSFADQGAVAGVFVHKGNQEKVRRFVRCGVFVTSLLLLFLATFTHILALNLRLYHYEAFSYNSSLTVLMQDCSLVAQPCKEARHLGRECESGQSGGVIRLWTGLWNPFPSVLDDFYESDLASSLGSASRPVRSMPGLSYRACEILVWSNPQDTLAVTSMGSSVIRVDASLATLTISHRSPVTSFRSSRDASEAALAISHLDPAECPPLHAAVTLSETQRLDFSSECQSNLWAVLQKDSSPLHVRIDIRHADRSNVDLRFTGAQGGDVVRCLGEANSTCVDTSQSNTSEVDATCNQSSRQTHPDFVLRASLQNAHFVARDKEPEDDLKVPGVLQNSTLEEVRQTDNKTLIVFKRGPRDQTMFLQPAAAPTFVHLPWANLKGLRPWWIAAMSGGLFPRPPRFVELQYAGCDNLQRPAEHLASWLPDVAWIPSAASGESYDTTWEFFTASGNYKPTPLGDNAWAIFAVALCCLLAFVVGLLGAFGALVGMQYIGRSMAPAAFHQRIRSVRQVLQLLQDLPCFWSFLTSVVASGVAGSESIMTELLSMPQVVLRSRQEAAALVLDVRREDMRDAACRTPQSSSVHEDLWLAFRDLVKRQPRAKAQATGKAENKTLRRGASQRLGDLGHKAKVRIKQLSKKLSLLESPQKSPDRAVQEVVDLAASLQDVTARLDAAKSLEDLAHHAPTNPKLRAALRKVQLELFIAIGDHIPESPESPESLESLAFAEAAALALHAGHMAKLGFDPLNVGSALSQVALRNVTCAHGDPDEHKVRLLRLIDALAAMGTRSCVHSVPALVQVAILAPRAGLEDCSERAVNTLLRFCQSEVENETDEQGVAGARHAFNHAASLSIAAKQLSNLSRTSAWDRWWRRFWQCWMQEEVYRQDLTHGEASRLMDAISRYQQHTRPDVTELFDVTSKQSREAFRAFGIKVVDPKNVQDLKEGVALVLESPSHKPRHLNLHAIEVLAQRAAALQHLAQHVAPEGSGRMENGSTGRLRYPHAIPQVIPHAIPVLRPGWLMVDIVSAISHAFICLLFSLWPCLVSLGLALAAEPYGHFAPWERLSSLYVSERLHDLPWKLLIMEPPFHHLGGACSVAFVLLCISSLRSCCTASIPSTYMHLAADMVVRKSLHSMTPDRSGARLEQSEAPEASKHVSDAEQNPDSNFQAFLRQLAVRVFVRVNVGVHEFFHALPWVCCSLLAACASAYASVVLIWLAVAMLVDSARMVPLVTSLVSFGALVIRRGTAWFGFQQKVRAQLEELADKLVLRLVGAGVASLMLPPADAQASFERLKSGSGSDADLFHVLARQKSESQKVVSLLRARLMYRLLLSKTRVDAVLERLGLDAALPLAEFLKFQAAIRAEVIRCMLNYLGLDTTSGWRFLRRVSFLAFLLFTTLLVVLWAFPMSSGDDPWRQFSCGRHVNNACAMGYMGYCGVLALRVGLRGSRFRLIVLFTGGKDINIVGVFFTGTSKYE